MWLDRLSGKDSNSGSPPPPQNRSYSPRRPSHLGPGAATRPGFSPRSSSLQLGSKSNTSTTSINSFRVPNGSTLKQQITPPADVTNPLEVLAEIVGGSLDVQHLQDEKNEEDLSTRPSFLVEEVEFNGLGIYEFIPEVEERGDGSNIVTQAVDECEYVYSIIKLLSTSLNSATDNLEKDKFEDLHNSILVAHVICFVLSGGKLMISRPVMRFYDP